MSTLIEIDRLPVGRRLEIWREAINLVVPSLDVKFRSGRPAQGQLAVTKAGDVGMFAVSSVAQTIERTLSSTQDGCDDLFIGITLRGRGTTRQDDRELELSPGRIAFYDASRPYVLDFTDDYQVLVVGLPRNRIVSLFGPTALYTSRLLDEAHGGPAIAAYFRELAGTIEGMPPPLAANLASLGVDLLIEGLASRLAESPTVSLSNALVMHRVKRYAVAHIGEHGLDVTTLAAGAGIPTRSLHQLFTSQGDTPTAFIWRKRLELARHRLSQAVFGGLTIGVVAWGCGFASQAHFSRRFKQAYGETPQDWLDRCRIQSA